MGLASLGRRFIVSRSGGVVPLRSLVCIPFLPEILNLDLEGRVWVLGFGEGKDLEFCARM